MRDLIVKNVDVMGDSIKAAKDAAGNIWVGVRWVCTIKIFTRTARQG